MVVWWLGRKQTSSENNRQSNGNADVELTLSRNGIKNAGDMQLNPKAQRPVFVQGLSLPKR
jgi:hypothetical protein